MVHEVVGRINGQYGTLTHVPIYHLDRQLSFNELVALYAITDVALVTSLRDGMNLGVCGWMDGGGSHWGGVLTGLPLRLAVQAHHALPQVTAAPAAPHPPVSYEYVACQRDNAGVLILSEFAGAAQSLGALLHAAPTARVAAVWLLMADSRTTTTHSPTHHHQAPARSWSTRGTSTTSARRSSMR